MLLFIIVETNDTFLFYRFLGVSEVAKDSTENEETEVLEQSVPFSCISTYPSCYFLMIHFHLQTYYLRKQAKFMSLLSSYSACELFLSPYSVTLPMHQHPTLSLYCTLSHMIPIPLPHSQIFFPALLQVLCNYKVNIEEWVDAMVVIFCFSKQSAEV